jgi:hypothetical protein
MAALDTIQDEVHSWALLRMTAAKAAQYAPSGQFWAGTTVPLIRALAEAVAVAIDLFAGGGGPHASSHEPGGADTMDVDAAAGTGSLRTIGTGALAACAGNDSRLSDARTPLTHSHAPADVTGTAVIDSDARLSDARTPTAHATSHKSGGGDAIKLDELDAPTDITTLDASLSAHGLLPKLGGGTSNFLRADGTWAAPPGGTGASQAFAIAMAVAL